VDYPFALQVLCPEGVLSPRRFVIHFQKAEDHPLARRVGSVLARLYWIGRDYLGRGPVGSEYTNVWLGRGGQAGGEEYQRNLYLSAVEVERAPAEWLRELAHEYAHLTLPLAGPFSAPERWASGYLGERLYLKWLLHDNAQTAVWDQPVDGDAYVNVQVTPLRDRFLARGTADPAFHKLDADGMQFFIARVLAVEALYGPAFLRRLLDEVSSPRPQNLELTLAAAFRELDTVTADARVYHPGRTAIAGSSREEVPPRFHKGCYRVFLPTGRWQVELSGSIPLGVTPTVDAGSMTRPPGTDGKAPVWHLRLSPDEAGWRLLEFTAPNGDVLQPERLTFTRLGLGD
jgi:hypothetical protein